MDVRVRAGAIAIAIGTSLPALAIAQPQGGPGSNDKSEPPATEDRVPDKDPKAGEPATPTTPTKPTKIEWNDTVEGKLVPAGHGDRFTWEPFGYLRLQYIVVQNDPNIAFVGRDDGFELQNARLGVRGQLRDRVRYLISIDGAVDEREQINVPEGKLRVGLRDAYADVALGDGFPGGAPRPLVRAGFFQTWVDPESQVPDTARGFVDKPIESRGIRATEGFQTQGLTPGRSLGAALRLEPQTEPDNVGGGVELAVQNGADEFASNNDNDKPAVSAAALLRVHGGTYAVVAGRYNPRTVGELPFRQDENDLQVTGGLQVAAGPVSIGGGGAFIHTTFPTTGGPAQNAYGAHAQVIVGFGSDELPIGVGYRFGILDPSSLIVTDRVMEHTAGAMLGVPALHMRFQLQLTHVIEQAARELSNSRAQLAVEVAL
ncbi:MAG TPA: hypothetical protein VFQ53_28695 [Kofleriaceae bacterium]|nr:hypothetical protein [Kofleriaceae bacterium]